MSGDPPAPRHGVDDDPILIAAYMFAGFAMMLNIRLSYSAAPFALLRFKLPENLFSVFVRVIAGALELWCLPSMLMGNIMDIAQKSLYASGVSQANSLKTAAGTSDSTSGKLKTLAKELYDAANNASTLAGDELNALKTAVGEKDEAGNAGNPANLRQALNQLNSASNDTEVVERAQKVKGKFADDFVGTTVQKAYNDLKKAKGTESAFGNVETAFEKLQFAYNESISSDKWPIIIVPSVITQWLNFLTFVILLIVYVTGGDQGHVTGYYGVIAVSGFVFGINMVLVYAVDYNYLVYYIAGENSFPIATSAILYFATSIFGNRRKYNSDYIVVLIDISISSIIALTAAILWTYAYTRGRKYIYTYGASGSLSPHLFSPCLMVIVGMGLVYSIYPGIAPGMIVPFYLIDKIEMVLLILTTFPPVIIALLQKYTPDYSVKSFSGWTGNNTFWHIFDILVPLKISLAVIFICSLHYRDSHLSRSIINQPKMSTALTIIFYMCHECLLAIGFPGIVGNSSGSDTVMLPVQYVGALFMIFLAFYSVGYITEYKKHDPSQWPTEGMTKWNALCYWLKMASKITNKNFKQLFTTCLLCDLIDCPTPCHIME